MDKLNKAGQVFFGICLAGLGLQQFLYPGFRPVLIPETPSWLPAPQIWVYFTGALLIGVGLIIIFNLKAATISFYTGFVFLVILLVFQLPFQFKHNPESLGAWTNPLKLLTIAGCCFITSASFQIANMPARIALWKKAGEIFLGVTLILFGIDHFLYVEFVRSLVPGWIPGDLFWTYFAAIALIGSGLSFCLNIKKRLVGILFGSMLFIWLVVLHIPRTFNPVPGDNGNELTSVFECLGFSGIGFLIARMARR
jgi:uncharacterized membrane protein